MVLGDKPVIEDDTFRLEPNLLDALERVAADKVAGGRMNQGCCCGRGHKTAEEVVVSMDMAARLADVRGGCRRR